MVIDPEALMTTDVKLRICCLEATRIVKEALLQLQRTVSSRKRETLLLLLGAYMRYTGRMRYTCSPNKRQGGTGESTLVVYWNASQN